MACTVELKDIIANLKNQLANASGQFEEWNNTGDEWLNPSWLIETCFVQLLAGLEALNCTLSQYALSLLVNPSKSGLGGAGRSRRGGYLKMIAFVEECNA